MAEEKINYMSMVVARKNNNTDNRGNGVTQTIVETA